MPAGRNLAIVRLECGASARFVSVNNQPVGRGEWELQYD